MIIIQIPPCVHSSVNRRWYWLSSALPGTASNWRRSFIRWTFFSPRLFKAPASCSRALSTCRLSWSWFAGASSSRLLRALNEQRGFSIIDIYMGKKCWNSHSLRDWSSSNSALHLFLNCFRCAFADSLRLIKRSSSSKVLHTHTKWCWH